MLLGQLCHSLPLHSTQDLSHTQQGLITRAQVKAETTVTRTQQEACPHAVLTPQYKPKCLQCLKSRSLILILLMATV